MSKISQATHSNRLSASAGMCLQTAMTRAFEGFSKLKICEPINPLAPVTNTVSCEDSKVIFLQNKGFYSNVKNSIFEKPRKKLSSANNVVKSNRRRASALAEILDECGHRSIENNFVISAFAGITKIRNTHLKPTLKEYLCVEIFQDYKF